VYTAAGQWVRHVLFLIYNFCTSFICPFFHVLFFSCHDVSLFFRSRDCGFFMLHTVGSWNGRSLTEFTCKDIPNIKKTMLFSWSTCGIFDVDLVGLFWYHPG
jgi:hypothetical protein